MVLEKIPYGKQSIQEDDLAAVQKALQDDFLTTGPKIKEFEEKFANYVGAKYAVAVSSGTAALHLACLAVGLKAGEELITSPLSFVASANCALYCGATPVFADITEQGLIDPAEIEKKITPSTKIIIPVHYGGLPCDLEAIQKIAAKHNLIVIEDACHALGARYKESKIGDCTYSEISCFSFHPVKHITTGEGGMITTNSQDLYEKLLKLRTHGINRNPEQFWYKDEGQWHQEMQELGYNYRMTDFQCALGMSQLTKISSFVEKRRELANKYKEAFKNFPDLETLDEGKEQLNSYHLFVIKVKNGKIRRALFEYLKDRNILCQVHYLPIYLQPYYRQKGYKPRLCTKAEQFYEGIISLPIYPGLTDQEQNKVIVDVRRFFREEKNMKILVIGCGSIGKRHIKNVKALLQESGEVIVYDASKEALEFVKKEYGVRTVDNLDQALEEADGVFICTPNHLHASQALQAVKKGCHVFVEKPLAHTMEHVEELLYIAKEKGLTVTCGYMLRFYEPLQKVKELLITGTIGKLYGAIVQGGYYLPDWRPTQDYRKNYGAIKAQGGGVILDCIHEIDYAYWLLGEAAEVFCYAGKQSNLEMDTEDYATIAIRLKNGIILHVHLDYLQRSYSRSCKIIGEKGTIIWNFNNHKVKVFDAEKKNWNVSTKENFDFNTVYQEEERHFLDCVAGKALPRVTGEEAKHGLKICLAALESAETGKAVKIQ